MRDASLNKEENVAKCVHQVYWIEDLLKNIFFESELCEIGDREWYVKLKKVNHDVIEDCVGFFPVLC